MGMGLWTLKINETAAMVGHLYVQKGIRRLKYAPQNEIWINSNCAAPSTLRFQSIINSFHEEPNHLFLLKCIHANIHIH